MYLALQDESKLDDTYSIRILISTARAALVCYDMHDVFNIAKVKSNGKNLEAGVRTCSLNTPLLLKKKLLKATGCITFGLKPLRQNLKLTQEFMANHTTERLWEKCLETNESFPPEEQGGPLIFIIMIKKLASELNQLLPSCKVQLRKSK